MVAATAALIPYAGWIYGTAAAGLGGWFLAEAHRLDARVRAGGGSEGSRPAPMRLFRTSIAYLTLLFAAVAVAVMLPWGHL